MKIRPLSFWCLAVSLALAVHSAHAAPKDPPYELIKPAVPVSVEGKLEVVELFWYTCPHCYYFEDYLRPWKTKIPADVNFVQIPAVFGTGRGLELAQAFYTAEALGVREKVHKPLFEAIHTDKKNLSSTDDFLAIFQKVADVKPEDFKKAWNSFAVDVNVRNAQNLTTRYGITAVPSVIVQGKYRLTSEMTDGYENMLTIINGLLDKERAAAKPVAAAPAAASGAGAPQAPAPATEKPAQ